MTLPGKPQVFTFRALENALALDALGYVCTPATTLETVVTEFAPVKGEDGKLLRAADGELLRYPQAVKKPAKVTIGSWHDAEPGAAATKERFAKQLKRISMAAKEYGLEQGADNLGVAIITSKSGIVVIDIDAGKAPDPDYPELLLNPDTAHDLLLRNILKTANIPDAKLAECIAWFKGQVHVHTPSGGWHYYFRRQPGQRPRMHTGMVKYVDVRAGYQNESGEWESSGVAYAPGNITQKGQYLTYVMDENGQAVELEMLPAVSELPELPHVLNALFEKSTTEIRALAVGRGLAVPQWAFPIVNGTTRADRNTTGDLVESGAGINDVTKWDDLAFKFVRLMSENVGVVH